MLALNSPCDWGLHTALPQLALGVQANPLKNKQKDDVLSLFANWQKRTSREFHLYHPMMFSHVFELLGFNKIG